MAAKESLDRTVLSREHRIRGLLCGVSAGDRNGGPQRLAYLLCDHLLIHKKLDPNILWDQHYHRWFSKYGFDTGMTFVNVAKLMKSDRSLTCSLAAQTIYERALMDTSKPEMVPKGVGSAHRNCVLSLFPFLIFDFDAKSADSTADDSHHIEEEMQTLMNASASESAITHFSPESKTVCRIINCICRLILMEQCKSIKECLIWIKGQLSLISPESADVRKDVKSMIDTLTKEESTSLDTIDEHSERIEDSTEMKSSCEPSVLISSVMSVSLMRDSSTLHLSRGGHSLRVLEAALHFIINTRSFSEALKKSVQFAGSANFCPVLVGALAGVFYGIDEVIACPIAKHRLNGRLLSSDKGLMKCVSNRPKKTHGRGKDLTSVLDLADHLGKLISELWA